MPPIAVAIDDDTTILEPMALLLESDGWQVVSFTSGEAFLDALAAHLQPTILIVDLRLAGMSGADVLRVVADQQRDIPAMVLTAYPDSTLAASALLAGAAGVLTKPIDAEDLLVAIRRAAGGANTPGFYG